MATAATVLTGCGDDSPPASPSEKDILSSYLPSGMATLLPSDLPTSVPSGSGGGGGGQGAGSSLEVKPPQFLLQPPTDPPAGYQEVKASCQAGGASSEGYGWVSFAVPAAWEVGGTGGGGSGGPFGGEEDVTFRTDGPDVTVKINTEGRSPDGAHLDSGGKPRTSYDYDYSVDGKTTHISFSGETTVSLDDQQVDVVVARQSQAPKLLNATEHKASVEAAKLPNPAPGDDDGYRPASYVVTISHDDSDSPLSADTIKTIYGSLAFPQCSRDVVVVEAELQFHQDLNGDGHVSTGADYQKVLSKGFN